MLYILKEIVLFWGISENFFKNQQTKQISEPYKVFENYYAKSILKTKPTRDVKPSLQEISRNQIRKSSTKQTGIPTSY